MYFPFLAEEELALSFYASCSARRRQKTVLAAIFANFLCVHSFLPLCNIVIINTFIINSKQEARLGRQVMREKIWNVTCIVQKWCMYCTRSKNQIDGHIEHYSMSRNLSENLQCGDHWSATGHWIMLLLLSSFSGHWLSLSSLSFSGHCIFSLSTVSDELPWAFDWGYLPFLATLVALHLTPVSKSVSQWVVVSD